MIKMTMTQPPPLNLVSPAVTPASPQHLEQIAAARKRGKTIMRCASIANGSAWTIALFDAASTAVTSLSRQHRRHGVGDRHVFPRPL